MAEAAVKRRKRKQQIEDLKKAHDIEVGAAKVGPDVSNAKWYR